MKVLGVKVEDEIYNEFAKYGTISDTLRKLVMDFLNRQTETEVNHTNSKVEYQRIRERKLREIHVFLQSLEDRE